MMELKEQMIKKRTEEFLKDEKSTYFSYALTGHYRKRSGFDDVIASKITKLVEEKEKPDASGKRNTTSYATPSQLGLTPSDLNMVEVGEKDEFESDNPDLEEVQKIEDEIKNEIDNQEILEAQCNDSDENEQDTQPTDGLDMQITVTNEEDKLGENQ